MNIINLPAIYPLFLKAGFKGCALGSVESTWPPKMQFTVLPLEDTKVVLVFK